MVRYDKFDSITLPLPTLPTMQVLSLGQLLSDYIATEQLTDVTCESCHETCSHEKSLTFAKLPACLCIHISRTTWLASGHASKRQDFVHFPESLSMAPYSFIQPSLSSQVGGGCLSSFFFSFLFFICNILFRFFVCSFVH